MVGFVEDQQRLRGELAQPIPQSRCIRLIDQQAVRDQKPGMGHPRIDGETRLAPHARHIRAVEDDEGETEAGLHLVAPLREHRWWAGHDDPVDPPAQQKLAGDQPGLDRLAEPDVVGDEQIDARQAERLAQGLELVGVDADAGAERRLEKIGVGGGNAVPQQRPQIRRKQRWFVEPLFGDGRPTIVGQHLGV